MPKPALRAVDNERLHPRHIARQVVKRWKSDATRLKLGVCNQHDSGAPSLRPDQVLNHASHDARLGRK